MKKFKVTFTIEVNDDKDQEYIERLIDELFVESQGPALYGPEIEEVY